MGFIDNALRSSVKTLNIITKSGGAQVVVVLERYKSETGYGETTYYSPVSLDAVVDWKQKQVRTKDGILSVSRAHIIFLDIDKLSKVTNKQGIDDNDRITLPDGTTGPILDMSGFIDPTIGRPFVTEVWLG